MAGKIDENVAADVDVVENVADAAAAAAVARRLSPVPLPSKSALDGRHPHHHRFGP